MSKRSIIILLVVLIASCKSDRKEVDVSGITVNGSVKRFEQDLFAIKDTVTIADMNNLRKSYGTFFDLFCFRMISIPEANDTVTAANLTQFINDKEVQDVHRMTDSVFANLKSIEPGLEDFLKHYKYYFPEKPVPTFVSYISAFNYAVITSDSVVGIGLDMFMGKDVIYYPRMEIPKYMFERFQKEYIVPSCIKAWFQSDYDPDNVKNELLSQMIYQGKLLYYIDVMVPDLADTLKIGYSEKQLEWCNNNESNVWAYFIEHKLLFSTNQNEYFKYINEGPTTSGFPKESPGKIGAWLGWKIVNAYMNKNSSVSLQDLLREKDAQKILEKSAYKPGK